jgi:hypothetical protein
MVEVDAVGREVGGGKRGFCSYVCKLESWC